jgi:hypothetical protein
MKKLLATATGRTAGAAIVLTSTALGMQGAAWGSEQCDTKCQQHWAVVTAAAAHVGAKVELRTTTNTLGTLVTSIAKNEWGSPVALTCKTYQEVGQPPVSACE